MKAFVYKFVYILVFVPLFISSSVMSEIRAETAVTFPHETSTLWYPYLEWSLINSTYSGNPFDLVATVTFTHADGKIIQTEMFYDNNNTWKFRFAGTLEGEWSFVTASNDGDLNGHTGTLTINANPDGNGFISSDDDNWIWGGTKEPIIPQYVMVHHPQYYQNNPSQIDNDIQTFIDGHGFNGFHVLVLCRWFDIDQESCHSISDSDPNPDISTFETLEMMISDVYEADGMTHIWAWGDTQRGQNPQSLPNGSLNNAADKRLQRYIAARLGPVPGWTMGYGFDLYEWVSESELTEWHNYMQEHMGWKHYLGGRSNPNPPISQISEDLDYSAYEQLKPDYTDYVDAIEDRFCKPSFSEDRFRIWTSIYPDRNWTMTEVRQTMWQSMMAGGIANIWGNLEGNGGTNLSKPFPNPEWIKTYSQFVNGRFYADMGRCNDLTNSNNSACLKRHTNTEYLFYGENINAMKMDLSQMAGSQTAVAVDAIGNYSEIDLGTLNPVNQTWNAPYTSDWAIAVGDFSAPFDGLLINTGNSNSYYDASTIMAGGFKIYLPLVGKNFCP